MNWHTLVSVAGFIVLIGLMSLVALAGIVLMIGTEEEKRDEES